MIRQSLYLALSLSCLGCGAKDDAAGTDTDTDTDTDSDTDSDTDTDTDSDTDADTDTDTAPGCDLIKAGRWQFSGPAFGMDMQADMQVNPKNCTFQLGNWDMKMDVPSGGTVAGDQVTLAGGNWSTCVGTLTGATFNEVQGVCSSDGDGFGMMTSP